MKYNQAMLLLKKEVIRLCYVEFRNRSCLYNAYLQSKIMNVITPTLRCKIIAVGLVYPLPMYPYLLRVLLLVYSVNLSFRKINALLQLGSH